MPINHRHHTGVADSGADVDATEWNDSLVVTGGMDGQVMTRNSGDPDGWSWGTVSSVVAERSTFAARPAPGTASKLWLPTDGIMAARDNGVSWDAFGPVHPFWDPQLQTFTWVNQGGATIDTSLGGVYLEAPISSSSNWRIRKKAVPAAPYTLDIAFIVNGITGNYQGAGIVLRDSGTGKLQTFGVEYTSTVTNIAVQKWSSATTFSANYVDVQHNPAEGGGVMFLRMVDDNTNRKSYFSRDGLHFQLMHSVGRTDFLTPDEIGFCANEQTNAAPCGMHLLSWHEE